MVFKRVSVRHCCAQRVAKPSLKRGLQTAGERCLGSPPCSDSCPLPISLPGILATPRILLLGGPASPLQGTSPGSFSALPAAPQSSWPPALVPRASCGSTQGLLGPVSLLQKPTWRICMARGGGSSGPAADRGPAAGPAVTYSLLPCGAASALEVWERRIGHQASPPHREHPCTLGMRT